MLSNVVLAWKCHLYPMNVFSQMSLKCNFWSTNVVFIRQIPCIRCRLWAGHCSTRRRAGTGTWTPRTSWRRSSQASILYNIRIRHREIIKWTQFIWTKGYLDYIEGFSQGQIEYRSRNENWRILWVTSFGESSALSQYTYIWPAKLRNLHSRTCILEMLGLVRIAL